MRKLVNMKFKKGGPIEDHLNEFLSVADQLATMKICLKISCKLCCKVPVLISYNYVI